MTVDTAIGLLWGLTYVLAFGLIPFVVKLGRLRQYSQILCISFSVLVLLDASTISLSARWLVVTPLALAGCVSGGFVLCGAANRKSHGYAVVGVAVATLVLTLCAVTVWHAEYVVDPAQARVDVRAADHYRVRTATNAIAADGMDTSKLPPSGDLWNLLSMLDEPYRACVASVDEPRPAIIVANWHTQLSGLYHWGPARRPLRYRLDRGAVLVSVNDYR